MASAKNHKIRSQRSLHSKAPFYMFMTKAQRTLEERAKHGIIAKNMQNPLEAMSDEKLAGFVN